MKLCCLFVLWCVSHIGWAQAEEVLSANMRDTLQRSVSDHEALKPTLTLKHDVWLNKMSLRLQQKMPDAESRMDFLKTLHYEAVRAGLEPELVLGLIEVKSNFKKYSVSPQGAQGYMQVMPFWVKTIGASDHNLFHLRTNLRYGCTILRHYLDVEKGNLDRALGRYDGSLENSEFPRNVRTAWHDHWNVRLP